jgi:hypothetical protein
MFVRALRAVRFEFNAEPVERMIQDVERYHLPFAASLALTNTAKAARRAVLKEFEQKFNRPKPSTTHETKGPLFVKVAKKEKFPNDYAETRIKDTPQVKGDPALVYLYHHVHGGTRALKRLELRLRSAGVLHRSDYAIPGQGARFDRYGNMSSGQVQEILSAFQGQRLPEMNSPVTQKTGKRWVKNNPKQADYFLARRARRKTMHLAEGIWQRYGRKKWQVRPVLIFVRRAPNYRARVAWDEINQGIGRFRFPVEYRAAMKFALETARVMPNPLTTKRVA